MTAGVLQRVATHKAVKVLDDMQRSDIDPDETTYNAVIASHAKSGDWRSGILYGGVQWVAVCGSVWQCVAVYCSVLRCVAVYGSVLRCSAVCCGVVQRVAV